MDIVIPIETKVREYHGKLWLSLNLIRDGHRIILGNISSINNGVDLLQPDLYFGDGAGYQEAREQIYRDIQQVGGSVFVLDTEGGVFRSKEDYERRLSPEILEYVDYFLAWGERPANILKQSYDFPEKKVKITGNPRFDLLQEPLRRIYEREATKIRENHGRIILVNTNFTLANTHEDQEYDVDDQVLSYQNKLLDEFVDALSWLSKQFDQYNIILRPHPSENHDYYKNEFDLEKNVHVIHQGDVRSWIHAAEAVIHNSCTTGIESALMNVPTFAYRPIKNADHDLELPNVVSEECDEPQELHDRIVYYIQSNIDYSLSECQRCHLKGYFHNIEVLSADKIRNIVGDVEKCPRQNRESNLKADKKQKIKRLGVRLFGLTRVEYGLERLTSRDYSYMRQKFPGLDKKEIQSSIHQFKTATSIPDVHVSQVTALGDVFRLQAGSKRHDF